MHRSNVSRSGLAGLFITVAALLLFSATAMAQVEQHSQISIQATALVNKDSSRLPLRNEVTRSAGFLLGYEYQFNRWAGVEGNYGYTQNTEHYFGLGEQAVRTNFNELTGAFVAHIPAGHLRPYVLAGTGALMFQPTSSAKLETGAQFQAKAAFLYGGGVNVDVSRHVGVRAEYRGFFYNVPDFQLTDLDIRHVTHLAQPSLGVFFRF